MKNRIHSISIDTHSEPIGSWGNLWVHRDRKDKSFVNCYRFYDLTRYQRAVRLLNAFVERNMK